jgi:hypothetical protein
MLKNSSVPFSPAMGQSFLGVYSALKTENTLLKQKQYSID